MKKIYALLVLFTFLFILSSCDDSDQIFTFNDIYDQTVEVGSEPIDWISFLEDEYENVSLEAFVIQVNDNTNYDVPGTYLVTITITDATDNVTILTFNITVTGNNETPEDPEDDPEDDPEVNVNASEMVQTLSSGRNNFMPDMDQIESDLESGDFMDVEDFTFYEVGCQYGNEYVDNGDGTYTQTFYYYDYDYDYYHMAEEVLYNGIDDDDDGEIDEDDEILIMVTDEMMDGIDNNNNGVVDEYFEMTPTHFVTYTMTFGEATTTYTTEDGVSTTTGYYSYEWVEIREPYTGQTIESTECYYDDGEEDNYNLLSETYDALMLEVETVVGDLDDVENQALYFELIVGRPLTDEEKAALSLVMPLYESFDDSEPVDDFENEINYLELYLDRALTEEERAAFELYYNYDYSEEMTPETEAAFELVDNLYMIVSERYGIMMYELVLGRELTEEEIRALEIVSNLYYDDLESLTDEQKAAVDIVENLEIELENSDVNEELLYFMLFLGRPLTDEEMAAFDIVSELSLLIDQAPSPSIEALVAFYENILGRTLTELEIEALLEFEV